MKLHGFLDDNAKNLNKIDEIPIYLPNSEEIDFLLSEYNSCFYGNESKNVKAEKIEERMLDLGWKEFISFEDFVNQEYKNSGKRCSMT